jgi:cysteine synthase A
MPTDTAIRTTNGRGRLFNSILDTVGDTPSICINNLGPDHATIYVKAEFFNPAASVKDRLAVNIMEEAGMNEEEIALSRSTPGFQFAAT